MKQIIYITITIILLILISLIVYFKLPFEITRKSDIKFGNELIQKIENYKKEFSELPLDNDWELFEQLGFRMEMLGTSPSYSKITNTEYELIYFEGFDGPYLLYNSEEKRWKVDYPKIQMEENFPWAKYITRIAIRAILTSIENTYNSTYDENFPTDIYNMPFTLKEKTEFEIVGYGHSENTPAIYRIDFHPKEDSFKSAPRITVEIDIEKAIAVRVYMTPDA